jgi:hypothetical protein
MNRDAVLLRVAALHTLLLGVLVATLALRGLALKGALLGGGLAGFSFLTFWVIARSITEPRKKALAVFLGSSKILLYLGLTALVLSGRLSADASGFALGVTCFVAAALGGALVGSPRDAGQPVSDAGGV